MGKSDDSRGGSGGRTFNTSHRNISISSVDSNNNNNSNNTTLEHPSQETSNTQQQQQQLRQDLQTFSRELFLDSPDAAAALQYLTETRGLSIEVIKRCVGRGLRHRHARSYMCAYSVCGGEVTVINAVVDDMSTRNVEVR